MARVQRIEYEGAVYHVTARGNDRRPIFQDDADRERFLHVLGESVERFEVRLYLFCLMTNHIHLVVETPRANLGQFMHRIETAYTVYFNRRHSRSGHLMQGRYGAKLVERDAYMLRLSRYVHLNPVFTAAARKRPAGERIAALREYRWSSYRSYIGKDRPLAFVDYAPVLAAIGSKAAQRRQAYRRFVESGIEGVDEAFLAAKNASPLCIGSEDFRDRIRAVYRRLLGGKLRREDAAFRRKGTILSAEEILSVVCRRLSVDRDLLLRRRRDSFDRAIASRMLCDHGGLTQRQVAGVLRIGNGACVSTHLRKLSQKLAANRALRNRVNTIAEELTKRRESLKA
jgi:putative transposase